MTAMASRSFSFLSFFSKQSASNDSIEAEKEDNELLGNDADVTPPPEVRISSANCDLTEGNLKVEGWCVTCNPAFDLIVDVPGTSLLQVFDPTAAHERLDVKERFPNHGTRNPGWLVQFDLTNVDLPTGAKARVTYVDRNTTRLFEAPIKMVTYSNEAEHDKKGRAGSLSLRITRCEFNPLRGIFLVKAILEGAGASEHSKTATWSVRSALGVHVKQPELSIKISGDTHRKIIDARFVTTGVGIGDKLELVFSGETTCRSEPVPITELQNSATRSEALTSSRLPYSSTTLTRITRDSMIALRKTMVADTRAIVAGSVCFYPGFKTRDELSNQYHRASWYLGGSHDHIGRVAFFRDYGRAEDGADALSPPDDAFDADSLTPGPGFVLLDDIEAYSEAINEAAMILVWQPISEENLAHLKRLFQGSQVLPIATNDPSAAEYGNWAKAPWALLPPERRKAQLKASQTRFREILASARKAGKTCSAVLGTGPSLDKSFNYDFSNALSVACNTIVASERLLDHVNPTFVTSGDAVSHFGVSRYAGRYRRDLIDALKARDMWFLSTASMGYVLAMRHPEIADRVLLCEQTFSGINVSIDEVWSLPRFDSTLNIHMLPIATTFSDTIYMIGFDGKHPDPAENEDFWAHSREAHYHDLVETGHACHPTFAINRSQSTADRFLASVHESFTAAEMMGKRFLSLESSFTPAIDCRQVPMGWLRSKGKHARLALDKPTLSVADPGRRALVIMSSPRAHFSGGRYHATFLALALAESCEEVVIWCTNTPPWTGELALHPGFSRLRFVPNDFISEPDGAFDIVIFVPHLPSEVYILGYEIAQRNGAKTAFLSFESPNWFNALSPVPRPADDFATWYAGSCFADVILCSAQTAIPFATEFHRGPFGSQIFAVAPPAVNDSVVDQVRSEEIVRADQIIVFGRFGSSSEHKNIQGIVNMMPDGLEGWTLALVAGASSYIDPNEIKEMEAAVSSRGMKLRLLNMISDRTKFREIARSRVMVFPSLFEGFGYPPVEAAHVGTPCVMYDLPVLKEFNSDHGHFVPTGDEKAMQAKIAAVIAAGPPSRDAAGQAAVCAKTRVSAFAKTLREIFDSCDNSGRAIGFSSAKFDAAMTYYKEREQKQLYPFSNLSNAEVYELAKLYKADLSVYLDAMRTLAARGVV